ncbi:MAG: alpha/beta fold hydrolase [Anaerolineales bacterium]|nr:alpha/beta fold hydrolase [Anaerolineales bacterium]
MRGKKLFVLWGAVVVLLLVGCTGVPETAVSPPLLTSCRLPGGVNAECGTLSVLENRDVQNGRTIDIHFAVIPAGSSISEPDPVFMLAGGPGQAASEVYPLLIPLFDELAQNRDIVLVDQRGTGQSNPLDCPNLQDLSLDTPDEEVYDLIDVCRRTLSERADLTQYITDIAMQDLDEVRVALDYEQINLLGTSYGTRAALSYMRLFPDNVRTVVLNAVTGPELVLQLQAPADGQRALDLLFARCRADAACQSEFPDFEAQFAQIMAALGDGQAVTFAHPTTGQRQTITLDEDDLMQSVYNLLYSPDLLSLLPLLVDEVAATGDYGPLVAQIVALSANLGLYQGMFYAVTCSEDAALIDPDAASAANADSRFPSGADEFVMICENWPPADVSNAFRRPLVSDIPALLLSGEADPITPPQYAAQVAAGLSNSQHLVLPGYGHDVLTAGCIPALVTNFITAGTITGLDISCTDEIKPPPFFVSPSGPQP